VLPQKEVGEFLAAASGDEVLGLGLGGENGVEEPNRELGEKAHIITVTRAAGKGCDGRTPAMFVAAQMLYK
jgi:hypothetical protein